MNLASLVDQHPGDAVALINRGRTTSYAELRAQVDGLRGGLTTLGLQAGDRIGVSCGNNGHFVLSYLAALGAGLVVVPLNPASPAPEVERELATTGARAVIVGPSGRGPMSALDRGHVPSLEFVIATDPGDAELGAAERLFDELLVSPAGPFIDLGTDDLAVLMFTSGTAGSPKAAMLTHSNLLANLEQLQASPGRSQTAADVVFGVLPLFHIFGLNVVLGMCLAVGSPLLLIERFDPVSTLESIERHHVTIVSGPPTMWVTWAALPGVEASSFASVRLAASGAAKLPNEVAEVFQDQLGLVIAEGYGLTEAAPVVTSAAGVETRRGSIGVPLPGVDVRLVDDDGEDVLLGDPGEIWVSGPNVFPGYWQDEAATAPALTPDGWLRTGDIAVVDDDGFLYLVDRAKDLVIVSGFNVFPAEVEDALLEHPAVDAAAVVGVAHPHTGEAVKAFVVAAAGRAVEEDDLIAFCAERLARYKCPSKVMFVEELPQGLGGKVLRRALG